MLNTKKTRTEMKSLCRTIRRINLINTAQIYQLLTIAMRNVLLHMWWVLLPAAQIIQLELRNLATMGQFKKIKLLEVDVMKPSYAKTVQGFLNICPLRCVKLTISADLCQQLVVTDFHLDRGQKNVTSGKGLIVPKERFQCAPMDLIVNSIILGHPRDRQVTILLLKLVTALP